MEVMPDFERRLGVRTSALDPSRVDGSRVIFALTPLKRDAEVVDQSRSREGLRQEANCSRLQRSGATRLVGEGRDENERRAIALGAHHRQELQTAHPRHLQIRNHARREGPRPQKVLGGRISLNRISVRPQKLAGRRTNRRIIVDDGNNWNR